ncbi:MAG: transposase, partial [Lachnospiraceae bacterium]|nr:transposase [Lachnospiraceae bacterium]
MGDGQVHGNRGCPQDWSPQGEPFAPFFVTEKKRSEQALIQVVQECWLNGVSTRKIENIARRLGIESL